MLVGNFNVPNQHIACCYYAIFYPLKIPCPFLEKSAHNLPPPKSNIFGPSPACLNFYLPHLLNVLYTYPMVLIYKNPIIIVNFKI